VTQAEDGSEAIERIRESHLSKSSSVTRAASFDLSGVQKAFRHADRKSVLVAFLPACRLKEKPMPTGPSRGSPPSKD
jgi:hypothetical protein